MSTRLAGVAAAVATLVGCMALAGCSQSDEFCDTVRAQFVGVSTPASSSEVDEATALSLSSRYSAVSKVAPSSSKGSWQALAQFWADYAAAAGDTAKLAELREAYAEISDAVATVKGDVLACNLAGASAPTAS